MLGQPSTQQCLHSKTRSDMTKKASSKHSSKHKLSKLRSATMYRTVILEIVYFGSDESGQTEQYKRSNLGLWLNPSPAFLLKISVKSVKSLLCLVVIIMKYEYNSCGASQPTPQGGLERNLVGLFEILWAVRKVRLNHR